MKTVVARLERCVVPESCLYCAPRYLVATEATEDITTKAHYCTVPVRVSGVAGELGGSGVTDAETAGNG